MGLRLIQMQGWDMAFTFFSFTFFCLAITFNRHINGSGKIYRINRKTLSGMWGPKFVRTCSPKQSKHCQIWPRFPNPRSKTLLIQYFFCNKLEVDLNIHCVIKEVYHLTFCDIFNNSRLISVILCTVLLSKYAIKRWFNFLPQLLSLHTLP